MLHISISSLQDFMMCRRLYFYKRIKKYDRMMFSIPFLVGRTIHEGMNHVFSKQKDPITLMVKYFREEKKKIKEAFTLTEEQEKDLNEQEHITKGMLAAYRKKYAKMIRDMQLLGSEIEGAVEIGDNVTFVIKLDNIVLIRDKKILHELKTSKYITPDYIKHIQTNIQTAAYYYLHNIIWPKEPIVEIMYDVIRKPGIRQKKGESYNEYLKRLGEWYDKPDDMAVFHIERFKKPVISEGDLLNTVTNVSNEMLKSKHKEDYYQDFDKCHSYYGDRCPYYELCHEGGETKENLVLYQIRKSYHVNKSNKGVGK